MSFPLYALKIMLKGKEVDLSGVKKAPRSAERNEAAILYSPFLFAVLVFVNFSLLLMATDVDPLLLSIWVVESRCSPADHALFFLPCCFYSCYFATRGATPAIS